MDADRLRQLLDRLQAGETTIEEATRELTRLPFVDLGYARVDHHREIRQGLPEVVLGQGKTTDQIAGIIERMLAAGHNVLVTRVESDQAQALLERFPDLTHQELGRTLSFCARPPVVQEGAPIAIVTAGTSDLPVAEEAAETLRMFGLPHERIFDVGVAGIHRLFGELDRLAAAPAVIVVAGMEGALPSVVGGLLGSPVVAVPTSVGYGTSLGGFAALFGMLSGCAAGVTVVNIDNGFGAAMAVARIVSTRARLGGGR